MDRWLPSSWRWTRVPVAKAKPTKTRPVLDKADQTPVRRDFAFVVDEKVPAGDIARLALKGDPKLVTAARVFDVYRGASIGEGKKSVAVEVTLQAARRGHDRRTDRSGGAGHREVRRQGNRRRVLRG